MKRKMRLKPWVKRTLFVIILVFLAMGVFHIGIKVGENIAKDSFQLSEPGNEIVLTEESEKEAEVFEEKEKTDTTDETANEAEEATEEPYVIDTLILVNKEHPLPEEYEVELLTMYDKVNRAAKEAYQPLNDMLSAGRKEGLAFEICSSYRDVEKQKKLFNEDVEAEMNKGLSYEEAYEEVARWTMPPGHSEHSTGLAFDIVALSYQMLDAGQASTPETLWLHEHCAEYGFILRYPEGKEEITHISYESWHYRYVGVEAAAYIMEHGITLEEYLAEAH